MIKDLQISVAPKTAASIIAVKKHVSKLLAVDYTGINFIKTTRRSIDARHRKIMVNLGLRVYIGEEPDTKSLVTPVDYKPVQDGPAAIVVGAGPGGLFAALRLIELGIKPIVLERGKTVTERQRDIAAIPHTGTVDENSNYCFGEGGAGAFSDGKLYTRSRKRGSVEKILGVFH